MSGRGYACGGVVEDDGYDGGLIYDVGLATKLRERGGNQRSTVIYVVW